MKKIENSFYKEVFCNSKNKTFSNINNFIKGNLWLTPLIYIIGTIALLIRNKTLGLQFTTISLIQFSLIVVYLIIFLICYSFIEFNYISFFSLIKKKEKDKIIKIIGYIILLFISYIVIYCFIYMLINDSIFTIKLVSGYYIFWPIFLIFLNNKTYYLIL